MFDRMMLKLLEFKNFYTFALHCARMSLESLVSFLPAQSVRFYDDEDLSMFRMLKAMFKRQNITGSENAVKESLCLVNPRTGSDPWICVSTRRG